MLSAVYPRSANASVTVDRRACSACRSRADPGNPSSGSVGSYAASAATTSGRLIIVVHCRLVERAVRLDIAHPGARDTSEAIQRPDLIDHVVGEACRIHIDAAAAKTGQVPVAHLSADGDSAACGGLADSAHDVRVTC